MATASCSVANLRLDRWLEAWCWAGPIALWCSGAKLDLLSVVDRMFAVLLLQFDETRWESRRGSYLSTSSDVYLLDGTNWTVFATEDVLLGDVDYSRHLMTAGFASLPQWWSVDRSVQTLTHSFGWRKKSKGGVWTTGWVEDVWWRKLRQHYLDGSVPGVWRRLGGVTCSDSEQFHVQCLWTTDTPWTMTQWFFFSAFSAFSAVFHYWDDFERFSNTWSCGWHQTK